MGGGTGNRPLQKRDSLFRYLRVGTAREGGTGRFLISMVLKSISSVDRVLHSPSADQRTTEFCDKFYSSYQAHRTVPCARGFAFLVKQTDNQAKLAVPFCFWFCRFYHPKVPSIKDYSTMPTITFCSLNKGLTVLCCSTSWATSSLITKNVRNLLPSNNDS